MVKANHALSNSAQVGKGLLKIAAVLILPKVKSDPMVRAFIRRSNKS